MQLAEMKDAIAAGHDVHYRFTVQQTGQAVHEVAVIFKSDASICLIDGVDRPEVGLALRNVIEFAQGDADGHIIAAFFDGYFLGKQD